MDQHQTLVRDDVGLETDDAVVEPRRPTPPPSKRGLGTSPGAGAPDTPFRVRGFAGFSYGQLLIGLLLLAAAVWAMWATSKIFELSDRRVVSVRLAAIVNDFVSAEARSGTPPEQLAGRTRVFMTALDGVLKARAANGEVVLVGEAVVASSVPDVTTEVVADLAKVVNLAAPVAMPPATVPMMAPPVSGPPAAAPVPAPDAAGNPFGGAGAPADGVSQP